MSLPYSHTPCKPSTLPSLTSQVNVWILLLVELIKMKGFVQRSATANHAAVEDELTTFRSRDGHCTADLSSPTKIFVNFSFSNSVNRQP